PHGEAGGGAIFCDRLLAGKPLVINGDGGQTRGFVPLEDIAPPNVLAPERTGVTGALNLRTRIETPRTPIPQTSPAPAGTTGPPVHGPARPGEQRRSCLDPALAGRRLGWRPRVLLRDGLAATYEFFRKETTR